jgi:hypothetical protein
MTGVLNPLQPLSIMTVRRRFLLTPSFARLIRREKGGLRHVEGFFPEQRDRSSWVRLEEDRGLRVRDDRDHGFQMIVIIHSRAA